MAIDLIVEVMEHAPADLTPAERYALVVLAEDARLPSREVKHDITDAYLLSRLRLTEASWANTRSSLVRKKALEKISGGHRGAPARYRIPVFDAAMKVHRSGEPLATESFTDPVNQSGGKVHRSGEKRFTDPVNLTYITPSTPSTTPREQEAEEGASAGDRTREASTLVASLPADLQPGRGKHTELVALVAELLTLGWPASNLKQRLAQELPAKVGSLFAIQRDRLPPQVPYRKPESARPRDSPVPHCGACSPDRLVEDDDGNRTPCPTCHPRRKAHP